MILFRKRTLLGALICVFLIETVKLGTYFLKTNGGNQDSFSLDSTGWNWNRKWYEWNRERERQITVKEMKLDSDLLEWLEKSHLTFQEIQKLEENSCRIRWMNPFHPNLTSFFKPAPSLHCDTRISYFQSSVDEASDKPVIIMKTKVPTNLHCCYKQLRFGTTSTYKLINPEENCTQITSQKTFIPEDSQYIVVNCKEQTKKKRPKKKSGKGKTQTVQDHHEVLIYVPQPKQLPFLVADNTTTKKTEDKLNVIIIGFDQQSRLNFIRLMKKTFEYLKTELEAIDLQGFNKIGDATMNNTLGLMTGHDFGAVKRNRKWWNSTKDSQKNDTFFDELPFLWKNYSGKGYLTVYGDDYNSVFDYRFKGFRTQPTDYYLHPFIKWYHSNGRWKKLGKSYHCLGDQPAGHLLLNYAKSVSNSLRNHSYFSFLWNSRIHEKPGYAALYDNATLNALKYFEETGELNRSLVVLLSDHGWRVGQVMDLEQTRLENRMSFAFLLLPKWFRETYSAAYENLKENQYRVTTPYDLHATLLDIANYKKELSDEAIQKKQIAKNYYSNKGSSLFLPISPERSCAQAGIDETWCACGTYKKFLDYSPEAIRLATFSLKTINSWLRPFNICQVYELEQIFSVEVKVPSETVALLKHDSDSSAHLDLRNLNLDLQERQTFRVRFAARAVETQREAVFETTVFTEKGYDWEAEDDEQDKNTGKIRMSTEVFRLNAYGNSASCMSKQYSLIKFCTCRKKN